jgi:triosephosphate isomerase (TIM)
MMTARLFSPFFEVGPKNFLRQGELRNLLHAAEVASIREQVAMIVTLPAVEIEAAKRLFPGVLIFAQHMDLDRVGSSVGRVIAEALADAGADGVMLNHAQRPLGKGEIIVAIERAKENGLLTMVCARDDAEALSLAEFAPDILLYEPPSLIGHSGGAARPWISEIDMRVSAINPAIKMMHAGGIGTPIDAQNVMRQGAAGTGATSAIVLAPDRVAALDALVAATRAGWNQCNALKVA